MAGKFAVAASLPGQRFGWKAADRIKAAYEDAVGKPAVDKFPKGSLGAMQFAYTGAKSKADRAIKVGALTGLAVAS